MDISYIKDLYSLAYQRALRYQRGVGVILAAVVALAVLILYQFDAMARLELLSLDMRFKLRHAKPKASDIVFIDMAEDSVNAIGRWPWPRKWHAAIIKILSEYKPKAIAFDVIFSEPQDAIDDLALEEAIRQSGVVYMPLVYDMVPSKPELLYKGYGVKAIHNPLPQFMAVMKGAGHINAIPDADGILRRLPPIISLKGKGAYQFGVKIGLDILGLGDKDVILDPKKHILYLKKKDKSVEKIALDKENQLVVNWLGRWGEDFRHYSYIDVIKSYSMLREGRQPIIDLNIFRDKICLIGLTAAGLIDIKPVPVQNAYPAVGTNAMMINSIIRSDYIREAPHALNAIILLIVSVLVTLHLCNMRVLSGILFAIAAILCYAAFSFMIFGLFKVVIVTFYPIFSVMLAYVLTASYTQVLQSVERKHLFRQATRDGLTHLYNIRHFNLLLEAEFRNAAAYRSKSLSVIMADLDRFKQLNDNYGHQAGDAVLREVANIIRSKCRHTDIIGRYGGEEFIVLLAGSKADDASNIAEGIRSAIEAARFKFDNNEYSTTISIGVAEYDGESTKDELIGKADSALYQAKRQGKNRVCVYSKVSS
jgi:diguanylate cyclase (GGDEF)-like protein